MSTTAKKAIMRAKVQGVILEFMPKTIAEHVYFSDQETLAAKMAAFLTELNGKATTQGLTEAINALRQEMLGDVPVDAYNTFTELAQYIADHKEVSDALNEAIGNKADKTVVEQLQATVEALGALATKDTVSETDLDAALVEKINASSQGNHSHANKELLDSYDQTNANIKNAVDKAHEHENKTVLDGITAETVSGWNSKANIYYSADEPANLAEGDLWIQIIEDEATT